MPLVPLSFVVTVLLLLFLLRVLRHEASGPVAHAFVLLLAVSAVQTVLVGLRWGYGWLGVQPLMAVLASAIPPLGWIAFRALSTWRAPWSRRDAWHALPGCVVAALFIGLPFGLPGWGIDFTIILTFAGYGGALLWLSRLGPDGLVASRLDGALMSHRSLQLTGLTLLGSALSDLAISMDFAFGAGRHAPVIVSGGMTLILLLLGLAAAMAQGGAMDREDQEDRVAGDPQPASPAQALVQDMPVASDDDAQTAAALDAMMSAHQSYKDVDLNLTKLARRMGLPARTVSQAVNRVHGMSVSQYVNNHRIAEACRLLAQTDAPVTAIVFESGFMTKSNFNREFLRVTGLNPTRWRHERVLAGTVSV